MRKYGLIGYPLEHSFSKGYFTKKFKNEGITDCIYENYPIDNIEKIRLLIKTEKELSGLNVTIPYKEMVMKYLDEIESEARTIEAVNTIKIFRSGTHIKLRGYNTDTDGFERPLLEYLTPEHKSALILGTGGASKAVAWVLNKHGITYDFVSRHPKNNSIFSYNDLNEEVIMNHRLIINTSPVGMFPRVDECPEIPFSYIGSQHILYDLIYNPEETVFLRKGKEKKATLINGLPMLIGQAERSWQLWNSQD